MVMMKVIDIILINFDFRLKFLECLFCFFWFMYDIFFICLFIFLKEFKRFISLFFNENSIIYFYKIEKGFFYWGRIFFIMLIFEIC